MKTAKQNIIFIFSLITLSINAQKYEFQDIKDLDRMPVISQGQTGTCWSFSTSSFLESEIMRITGEKIDLSEMYQVYNTYMDKAENYIYRQGKANFAEGGLAHDVINSFANYGVVPNQVYNGLINGATEYNHQEMFKILESNLKTYASSKSGQLSPTWRNVIYEILDSYIGKIPTRFNYKGKEYTPKTFAQYTQINPKNYITITSFSNKPFYEPFILNIPDNFSNGKMYNLPLEEFIENIDNAITNGYTLSLDADVSEPTFSAQTGVAFIPKDEMDVKKGLNEIISEKDIDPQLRQQEFENYSTTDDHLMHIIGKAKDQKGNVYYKVKNSWGTNPSRVAFNGYIYMSASYLKLKSISVLLHKDGLKKETLKKLNSM